jgi:hypothetical protein
MEVAQAFSYTDQKTGEITSRLSNYSTIEQTAEAITLAVQNLETGMGHMLRLDESGLIVDSNGGTLKISNGNLNLTGAISFSQLSDGSTYMNKITNASNAASNAVGTADAALALAQSLDYDYLHSTYISQTEIRSPNIYGGLFYATGRGKTGTEAAYYLYDSWSESKGLGTQVGFLSYDDDGAGTTEEAQKRVLLTSTNGTAMKIHAEGNMSLASGGRIYMMTPVQFSNGIIVNKTCCGPESDGFPSSPQEGQLFFLY